MPWIIALHKFKPADASTVIKKVTEAFQQMPEGMALCSSYIKQDQTGAVCVWDADSAEKLKEFLDAAVPEMENETFPTLQWAPPSDDLYALMYALIS